MRRMKCTMAYDGSDFSGLQIQPNKRTIQGEIEQALQKIHKGEHVRFHGSGRTDSGVHAMSQVFHFDTSLDIDSDAWIRALTTLLPADIHIKQVEQADKDFHARFSALEKEYRYFVLNSAKKDVFRRNFVHHSNKDYDIVKMQQACDVFQGTHDFTSFSSGKSTAKGSRVRTIYEMKCVMEDNMIQFRVRGNGFLQHMVRIIVGALLEVGEGIRTIDELKEILHQKDRTKAGITAPASGLYLWDVKYG